MKKRSICPGLETSAIAIGSDSPGFAFRRENSFAMLDRYLEAGGNMIDTAHLYGISPDGETQMSEKLIGTYLKERGNRNAVLIATKGGHPEGAADGRPRLSRGKIFTDMDESLSCLGVDYVDLYWLHRDDEQLPVGPIVETLHELVKCGKTRFCGVSNWRAERIAEANAYAVKHGLSPIVASQIQYSYASPNYADLDPTLVAMDDIEYTFYHAQQLPVFAFASQAKGYFAKLAQGGEAALSEKCLVRYHNAESMARFARAQEVARQIGANAGQVALALLMCREDFPTVPILGCRDLTQLDDSLAAAQITLTPEQVRYLDMGV